MDSSDEGLEKIRVPDPGGGVSETVWAEPLGEGLYRIRNVALSPLLRHRDVVRCAPPAHEEDFPTFLEVVEASGNATAIVEFLRRDDPRVDPLLGPATAQATSWEWVSENTVAISLAQGPDYARFVEALEALEKEGVLKAFADEVG